MNNFDFMGNDFVDMIPMNMAGLSNNALQNMNTNKNIMNSNNTGVQNNIPLSSPQEGYVRGNLFPNLYDQYKNYRPATLNPKNEQERMFINLSELYFAAHELNLYLDNYPNDRNMIRMFNDYRTMANQALRAYEEKFSPITITSEQLNESPWMWEQLNFPWDKGGM